MTSSFFAGPRAPLALAATLFVALVAVSGGTTLWDRDEARFGRAAVEMASSGRLLVPTFGGEPRLAKPPLATWAMAASVSLFGASPRSLRLPSCGAFAVTAFLAVRLARRLAAPEAALVAGAAASLAMLPVLEGLAATADALLVAFLAAALLATARLLESGPRAPALSFLALACAGAQLAKGPVGLALPLLSGAAGAFAISDRPLRRRALVGLVAALGAGTALFLFWFVPANAATAGRFLAEGFGKHVAGRMASPLEGHGGGWFASLPYYVPVLLLGFAPWILFLPDAIARFAADRRPVVRLCAAAAAAPFVLFTFAVATKLPHYVLPAWPALGAGVALAVAPVGPRAPGWMRRAIRLFVVVLMAAEAGGFVALAVALPEVRIASAACAAILLVAWSVALGAEGAGRPLRAALAFAMGGLVLVPVGLLGVLPAVEAWKPVPKLAAALRAAIPGDAPAAAYGFGEPSLVFELGRPVLLVAGGAAAAAFLAAPGPRVLVATRDAAAATRAAAGGRIPFVELATASGIDAVSGRWIDLVALAPRQAFRAEEVH